MSSQAVSSGQNNTDWVLGTFHQRGPSGEFIMNGKPLLQAQKEKFEYLLNKATGEIFHPITRQEAVEKAKEIAKWNVVFGLASSVANVWLKDFHAFQERKPKSLTGDLRYAAVGTGAILMGLGVSSLGSTISKITLLGVGFGFGHLLGKGVGMCLKSPSQVQNQLAVGAGAVTLTVTAGYLGLLGYTAFQTAFQMTKLGLGFGLGYAAGAIGSNHLKLDPEIQQHLNFMGGALGLGVSTWLFWNSLSPCQLIGDFSPIPLIYLGYLSSCFFGTLFLPGPKPHPNEEEVYIPATRKKECELNVQKSFQFAKNSYELLTQANAQPFKTLLELNRLDGEPKESTLSWRQVRKEMSLGELFEAFVYRGKKVAITKSEGFFSIGKKDQRTGQSFRFQKVAERPVQ